MIGGAALNRGQPACRALDELNGDDPAEQLAEGQPEEQQPPVEVVAEEGESEEEELLERQAALRELG